MQALFKQSNLKRLVLVFLVTLAGVVAQESTSYMTPDVTRVGARLACRCGGCRNTVGDCPMLRCGSADPKRHQIYDLKKSGLSDDAIVSRIVQQEGIVALASPPGQGIWPIMTWVMPGVALLIGFFIYSSWVKRNRQEPPPLSASDKAALDRFRGQIEQEFEDETPAK